MSSAAEISSLSSTLAELHDRVTAMAEGALASGDEDMAHELIAVERSLGGRRSGGCGGCRPGPLLAAGSPEPGRRTPDRAAGELQTA